MRFRKSIRISKNLKLNPSKSGISATVGGRGISANVGAKGVYLNTSIPGTGLYDRKKIMSFDTPSRSASGVRTASGGRTASGTRIASGSRAVPGPRTASGRRAAAEALPQAITLALGPDGGEIIYDENGVQVTSLAVISKVKSTASYRQAHEQLMEQYIAEAGAATEAFVNIGQMSADVPSAKDYEKALDEPAPAEVLEPFTDPQPRLENVRTWLEAEARKNVQTLAVWNIDKKREEYVQARLMSIYDEECEAWEARKAAFEAQQREENAARREAWEQRREALRAGLDGGSDAVEAHIGAWLQSLELPIDFDVDYEYDEKTGTLLADMDLPELEHLPTQKLVEQSTGKLKNKDKTQKELRQEYAKCVLGLGMFCASHFFCVTPKMRRVLLSGYTQRRDPKTGDSRDEFIYSVVFEREPFEQPGYQTQEPERFLNRFKNRLLLTANGELKKIVPFEEGDLD